MMLMQEKGQTEPNCHSEWDCTNQATTHLMIKLNPIHRQSRLAGVVSLREYENLGQLNCYYLKSQITLDSFHKEINAVYKVGSSILHSLAFSQFMYKRKGVLKKTTWLCLT